MAYLADISICENLKMSSTWRCIGGKGRGFVEAVYARLQIEFEGNLASVKIQVDLCKSIHDPIMVTNHAEVLPWHHGR